MPISAKLNTNANNPAKSTSRIKVLSIVKIRDIVPFPIDWKMFPAKIPSGMNSMKKHNMRKASTTLSDSTALLAEYENINDNGSANIKKNEQMISDEIKPNLTP